MTTTARPFPIDQSLQTRGRVIGRSYCGPVMIAYPVKEVTVWRLSQDRRAVGAHWLGWAGSAGRITGRAF